MDFDWNMALTILGVSAWLFILALLVIGSVKLLLENKHIKCAIVFFSLCVWLVFPMVMGLPMRLIYGW
jgi:hypothetical protein